MILCVYANVCMCENVCVCECVRTNVRMCVCAWACVYLCMHARVCAGTCMHVWTCVCSHGKSAHYRGRRRVDEVDDGATEQGTPYKVLVCCGASHMAYGFGVPERAFAAHPALRDDSYRIYAYETDAERTVLTDEGLRDVFGASSSTGGVEVADVAFVYDKPSKEE